ncbi:hypothetical protein CPT_Slocum_107 [Serratia phage Slocum]|nr:hypothetical protein CPT_Slocum_107 [Serratia phage Slocum]
MTKNDAYKYAKSIFRKRYTKIQIENVMSAQGHSEQDIALVKDWLSKWTMGVCY